MRCTPNFCFAIASIFVASIWVVSKQITTTTTIYDFLQFLKRTRFCGRATRWASFMPFGHTPCKQSKYWKVMYTHMHMVCSINVSLEKTSNAWTLVLRTYNSSTSGCKYTSTFSAFKNFFLKIIRANVKKYHQSLAKEVSCNSIISRTMSNGMN